MEYHTLFREVDDVVFLYDDALSSTLAAIEFFLEKLMLSFYDALS